MSLEAKIKNVGEWKSILQAIGDMVDEAMFICSQEGITFRGIDPSHVALLDITFPTSSFELFNCHTAFFGIKVEEFKNILNAAGNDDIIELKIDDPHKIRISIRGSLNMEYDLNLIEKTQVNTPIPRIEAKSKISLSPSTLSRIISNIERISEHVTITTLPEKVQFFGRGDVVNAKVDLEKANPELSLLEVLEDSSSMYSLEYMAKIIRNIGRTCKNISMEYGTKTPIHMMFEMPSLTKVEYYLAPRIES